MFNGIARGGGRGNFGELSLAQGLAEDHGKLLAMMGRSRGLLARVAELAALHGGRTRGRCLHRG